MTRFPSGLRAIPLVFVFLCGTLAAQEKAVDSARARGGVADTARTQAGAPARPDSLGLAGDSTRPDSLGPAGDSTRLNDTSLVFSTKNSVDTVVTYVARDSVVYRLNDKTMQLYGQADIKYGSTEIKAERITLNWDESQITARGIPDTSAAGKGKEIGTPVFREGSESYEGRTMTYNFTSKRGVIAEGQTTIEDGFYLGEKIKRMSDDVYFIGGGRYTTCDNPDHKHYYFGSPKMKVIPNDVIVAEPIVLYIEDIPLFALPFAVFPSKKGGRSSGFVIPTFGEHGSRGRYLVNGGYYFAASDYWDLRLTGDWYWNGGYRVGAGVNYALRYNFTGSVSGAFGRQRFQLGNPTVPDDAPQSDFELHLTHNQQLDPLSRIDADFNFMTQSYIDNFSTNVNQLLQQEVYSRASYSTSWEGTNRSLSAGIQRQQDLRTNTWSMTLPDITFNQAQIYPFRPSAATGEEAWYELIGFNYSAHLLERLNTQKRSTLIDTVRTEVTDRFERRGIEQRVSLIASPKLGYLTISPSFSYLERWYDHRIERSLNAADSSVNARDARGFYALHTFNAALSLSTKLYGMVAPGIFGIEGIRHTLLPSLSYTFAPDFSAPEWGYYLSYRNERDSLIEYDPYSGYEYRPSEVFSGVGRGGSQTLGLSLQNIFEMKVAPGKDDTTGTSNKFQLLTLNASTSYNFENDSMRLGPVALNFRTNIEGKLDVYGGASFSPYVYVPRRTGIDASGREIVFYPGGEADRYLLSEGKGLARMTAFDIHLSTSLSSEMFTAQSTDTSAAATAGQVRGEESFSIPWSMSFGYDYSINQSNPQNKFRSSSMRASLEFKPTRNWRITTSTYYDFVARQISVPRIDISRDLHCWEMNFSWVPFGPAIMRNFQFVIRLKAPQLQDIKLELEGNDRGVFTR